MMKILRILSKKAGFRRGGIAHPDVAMVYPADRFSKEQLEQLRPEPTLDVVETEVDVPEGITIPAAGIAEAELKALVEGAKKAPAPKGGAKS